MLATQGTLLPEIIALANDFLRNPLQFDKWIREHFRYRGEREEVLRTVDFMLNQLRTENIIEGDCDDISIFLASVTLAAGTNTRFVAIETDGDGEYNHVYVEVLINDKWYVLDPTVESGTPYEYHERMYEYA
jgi:transglutaminase-like putative cysteine protease